MNILLAYDGSHAAQTALNDIVRSGLPRRASATVLTVADVWIPPDDLETSDSHKPSFPEAIRRAREQAREALEKARSTAVAGASQLRELKPEWSVNSETTADSPAWAVIKLAETWPADLILAGSHGPSRLDRLLLGSVSQKILAEASCSVRIGRKPRRAGSEPVRIVLGLDGSNDSRAAVDAVARREWPADSEVRLLTAIDDKIQTAAAYPHAPLFRWLQEDDEGHDAWISRMIASERERLEKKGLRTSVLVNSADPKAALVEEAASWDADMIFIGARGHRMLNRFLLGSVSSAVAARAACSVEVVRPFDANRTAESQ
jgi:nucleotide-binding universal stress UspA family protein